MAPTMQILGAAILFCSLIMVSARDLRRRGMIEVIADGCRIGKTEHYICCFECETCEENGVKDVPSCRGRRLVDYWDMKRDTDKDYWMQRRLEEVLDTKRESADYWQDKRESADYWQNKRDAADYWQNKRDTADYWQNKRDAADYWQGKRELDYWLEKRRGPKCRVKVIEGVHKCCVRRNGCACARGVVARCG